MAEPGDYAPAAWAAQTSFKSARQVFDHDAGRGYQEAKEKGVKASSLVPASIETESSHPFLIRVDGTGSMGSWPGPIFAKMGYMDHELRTEYLSEDMEVSFGLFCDVDDEYPLQVQKFVKGADLQKAIKKLVFASGGSGPGYHCEAQSVSALYDIRNVRMPNSLITPPLIFVTDEMPYEMVSVTDAKCAKAKLNKALSADVIFEELMAQYSVYVILKPYGGEALRGDKMDSTTQKVYDRWEGLIGAERIALLSQADRVVDVIFGLLAAWSGRVDYFRKEIEDRQKPGQVKTVYKALETVHELPSGKKSVKRLRSGVSQLRPRKTKKKTRKS